MRIFFALFILSIFTLLPVYSEADNQDMPWETPEIDATQAIIYNENKQVINSLQTLMEEKQYPTVLEILGTLNDKEFTAGYESPLNLYRAASLLQVGKTREAKTAFDKIHPAFLSPTDLSFYQFLHPEIDFRNNLPLHSGLDFIDDSQTGQAHDKEIWGRLQLSNLYFLSQYQHKQLTPDQHSWVELATISRHYNHQTTALIEHIKEWQNKYPTLQPVILDSLNHEELPMADTTSVAVILPLTGHYKTLGYAVQNGITDAFYRQNNSTSEAKQIRFYDSNTADSMKTLYKEIIDQGNTLIIGPLTKSHVEEFIDQVSPSIPALTLNYTADHQDNEMLYQFGLSPIDEVNQTAIMAWRKGHQNALIIAPDTSKGKELAKAFKRTWATLGGRITDTYLFPQGNQELSTGLADILKITESQTRSDKLQSTVGERVTFSARERKDFDVILLVANTAEGKQIKPLLKFYYVTQPVYSIASIIQKEGAESDPDLDGIVFCDMPWEIKPSSKMKSVGQQLTTLWGEEYQQSKRLYALGMDAFYLAKNSSRFNQLPLFPYEGNTGEIFLHHHGKRFFRQLSCARFSHGSIRSFT
jgi:outer membrane PBP1 activator LpoA protein